MGALFLVLHTVQLLCAEFGLPIPIILVLITNNFYTIYFGFRSSYIHAYVCTSVFGSNSDDERVVTYSLKLVQLPKFYIVDISVFTKLIWIILPKKYFNSQMVGYFKPCCAPTALFHRREVPP